MIYHQILNAIHIIAKGIQKVNMFSEIYSHYTICIEIVNDIHYNLVEVSCMFSERLKALRKQKGITQEALAREIKVERSSIGKYEGRSATIPSDDVKKRIAEYFDVSVDYLLGLTEVKKINENKIEPTAQGDGLDEALVNLLVDLSPAEVRRVEDFVAGIKAARTDSASRQE